MGRPAEALAIASRRPGWGRVAHDRAPGAKPALLDLRRATVVAPCRTTNGQIPQAQHLLPSHIDSRCLLKCHDTKACLRDAMQDLPNSS
eukprot:9284692-Pyramimonas_sp.AAC.1